ncbi:MAG: hypothetical protein U0174_09575 [Polyangiaceae bacterium]
MNTKHLNALSALLRLARRRELGTEASLLERFNGSAEVLRVTLRELAGAGLVERLPTHARLTMLGFAVAVSQTRPSAVARRGVSSARRAA